MDRFLLRNIKNYSYQEKLDRSHWYTKQLCTESLRVNPVSSSVLLKLLNVMFSLLRQALWNSGKRTPNLVQNYRNAMPVVEHLTSDRRCPLFVIGNACSVESWDTISPSVGHSLITEVTVQEVMVVAKSLFILHLEWVLIRVVEHIT